MATTQMEGTKGHIEELIRKLKMTIRRQEETLKKSQDQLAALEGIKK